MAVKKVKKKKVVKKKAPLAMAAAAAPVVSGAMVANAIALASGDHRLSVRTAVGAFDVVVDMPGVNPLWSLSLLDPSTATSRQIAADQSHFAGTVDGLQAGVYLLVSHALFTQNQGVYTQVCTSTVDQETVKMLPGGGQVQTDVMPVIVG